MSPDEEAVSTSVCNYMHIIDIATHIQDSTYSSETPHAAWLTNKQFLSPLLVEYDHTISELNGQVASYQTELTTLVARVQEITDENTKLHSDLRKSLESRLKSPACVNGESVQVEAVQEQMDILARERDSHVDLWRQTTRELEILQRSDRVSLFVAMDWCDY